MQICSSIPAIQSLLSTWRAEGQRIGFVPTMGNLHQGHFALVKAAQEHCDRVVVSIFVNPMQFGENEDLDSYPRTREADTQGLSELSVDAVFIPQVEEIYPRPVTAMTFVEVPEISDILCGASRPGHFRGVTTVVNKFFNVIQPDAAIFGLKDFQQFTIIQRMVEDLSIPVELIGLETVREPDGLALSSRNGYLTRDERKLAPGLYQMLQSLSEQIQNGEEDYLKLEQQGRYSLEKAGFKPDYVAVRCAQTLLQPEDSTTVRVILAAAWLGKTRLIDNIQV